MIPANRVPDTYPTAANAVLNVQQFLSDRIDAEAMGKVAMQQCKRLRMGDGAHVLYQPTEMLVTAAVRYAFAASCGHDSEAFALRHVLHALSDWVEAVAKRTGHPIAIANGNLLTVIPGDGS